jgi:hypothetical protein
MASDTSETARRDSGPDTLGAARTVSHSIPAPMRDSYLRRNSMTISATSPSARSASAAEPAPAAAASPLTADAETGLQRVLPTLGSAGWAKHFDVFGYEPRYELPLYRSWVGFSATLGICVVRRAQLQAGTTDRRVLARAPGASFLHRRHSQSGMPAAVAAAGCRRAQRPADMSRQFLYGLPVRVSVRVAADFSPVLALHPAVTFRTAGQSFYNESYFSVTFTEIVIRNQDGL